MASTFRAATFIQISKLFGIEGFVLPILKVLFKGRKEHAERTGDKLNRRIEMKTERHDLIAPFLTIKDQLGMERLRVNAGLLILAGSETTATLLSGVTYLLLLNPECLRKLTDEVRSSFKSDKEIALLSVGNLTYMLACLNEALRMYSPVAGGFPRNTANREVTVDGYVVPKNVSLNTSSLDNPYAEG